MIDCYSGLGLGRLGLGEKKKFPKKPTHVKQNTPNSNSIRTFDRHVKMRVTSIMIFPLLCFMLRQRGSYKLATCNDSLQQFSRISFLLFVVFYFTKNNVNLPSSLGCKRTKSPTQATFLSESNNWRQDFNACE